MSEPASATPSFDFCRSCGTHYRGRAKEFLPVKTQFMRDPEEGAICVLAQCLCGSRIPVKVAAGPYYFIGRIWRDTRWTTIIVQYVRQVQRGDGKATGYVLRADRFEFDYFPALNLCERLAGPFELSMEEQARLQLAIRGEIPLPAEMLFPFVSINMV